jgi:hypothetical protein
MPSSPERGKEERRGGGGCWGGGRHGELLGHWGLDLAAPCSSIAALCDVLHVRKETGRRTREEKKEKRKEEGKKIKNFFFQTWKFLEKIKDTLRSWSKIIFCEERYLPNYK